MYARNSCHKDQIQFKVILERGLFFFFLVYAVSSILSMAHGYFCLLIEK